MRRKPYYEFHPYGRQPERRDPNAWIWRLMAVLIPLLVLVAVVVKGCVG